MYRRCAFCNGALDGDGGPSGLGVGRRFAFDEHRARLWVVCGKCGRWNLTPLDDRLERLDAVARAAAGGRTVAASAQIALLRAGAYDYVRVGRPPRVEYAAWRYGQRLKARRREQAKYLVPISAAILGTMIAVNVVAGGSMAVFLGNVPMWGRLIYTGVVGYRPIALGEPPVCARCGTVMRLRARHLEGARVVSDRAADVGVVVTCPACGAEGAQLSGADAQVALRRGLTYLNLARRGRQQADRAAALVEGAGGADSWIRRVARADARLRSLDASARLALEMAVDERLELAELEQAASEAAELAEIADGPLSASPDIEAALERLRRQSRSNGSSISQSDS